MFKSKGKTGISGHTTKKQAAPARHLKLRKHTGTKGAGPKKSSSLVHKSHK